MGFRPFDKPDSWCHNRNCTMKDKKFLFLSALFFLIFLIGIGIIALRGPTSSFLKAKNTLPSGAKSFAIIFPQVGKNIKVTVTMRDEDGNVISGREVKVVSSIIQASISPSDTQTTNQQGQATYTLTSDTPGKATLEITDVGANLTLSNVPSV